MPSQAWFKSGLQLRGGWGRRPKGNAPRCEASAPGARWLLPARSQPPNLCSAHLARITRCKFLHPLRYLCQFMYLTTVKQVLRNSCDLNYLRKMCGTWDPTLVTCEVGREGRHASRPNDVGGQPRFPGARKGVTLPLLVISGLATGPPAGVGDGLRFLSTR